MSWNLSLSTLLAQAQAAVPAAPETPFYREGWFVWLLLLASLVLSITIGRVMSRSYRMPEYDWKISLIMFSLLAGIVVTTCRWPPRLGIDLKGGVILVYQTQGSEIREVQGKLEVALKAEAPEGKRYTVEVNKDKDIEITLPGADDDEIARVRKLIDKTYLEHFAVSFRDRTNTPQGPVLRYRVAQTQETRKTEMDKLVSAVSKRINPSGVKELTIRPYGPDQIEVIIPEGQKAEVELIKRQISTAGVLEFRIVANRRDHPDFITKARALTDREKEVRTKEGVVQARWVKLDKKKMSTADLVTREVNNQTEVLMVVGDEKETVRGVLRASTGVGEDGGPIVKFNFDTERAAKFQRLTSRNLPQGEHARQLGIVLDNTLQSAPSIRSTISSEGQITGKFTQEDVDFLVGVLNAGSLPSTLDPKPIREQNISAQLGEDTVRRGAAAMVASVISVLCFMLVYYRLSGTIAVAVLLLNVLLTVAAMISINAAFTLAGLAGLVLGTAMCVDSNVLIYERIREELDRGAGLRMAIRNGFNRSSTTIIDSHVTTLITAIILYWIGSELIRSFAVTLFIGLTLNLYTAVFCSRVIFEIGEKRKMFAKLSMMRMFSAPKIDFIGLQTIFLPLSAFLLVLSMVGIYLRGQDMLDIDFTGGSSVQFVLREGQTLDVADVRTRLEKWNNEHEAKQRLDDLAVSRVNTVGEKGSPQFKIDTSQRELPEVRSTLQQVFKGDLATYAMNYGKVGPIEAPGGAKSDDDKSDTGGTTKPKAEDEPKSNGAKKPDATRKPDTTKKPDATKKPDPATPDDTTTPDETKKPDETKTPDASKADKPADPDSADDESKSDKDPKAGDKSDDKAPSKATDAPDEGSALNTAIRTGAGLALADELDAAAPAKDDADDKDANKSDEKPAEPKEKPKASDKSETEEPAPEPKKPEPKKPAKPEKPEPTKEKTPATTKSPTTGTKAPSTSKLSQADQEFVGGSKAELTFETAITNADLRNLIYEVLHNADANAVPRYDLNNSEYEGGDSHAYKNWTLRIALSPDLTTAHLDKLKTDLEQRPVFLAADNIEGRVAADIRQQAIIAVIISSIFIAGYIWFRFQDVAFGLGAVVALVHDVILPVGLLAWSKTLASIPLFKDFLLIDEFKISLAVLAAILTLIGWSLNDTIVICDRIREVRGKSKDLTAEMVNTSINQTLSRTMLTGVTVLLVLIILYIWGGQGVHAFSFVMLVGVVIGTYSSVFVAAPLLVWLHKSKGRTSQPGVRESTARPTSNV